jgi:TolB-like protein
VLEKEELLRLVWPGVVVEEGNLSQHVFTLRKLLGDTSDAPAYLATVPRRGYQFVGEVLERQRVSTTASAAGPKPGTSWSLAVLPFAALTSDPADQFLGYGMAEALIAQLRASDANVRSAGVIARFAAAAPDTAQAGRDLGVDTVLQGAVQKRADWICITAQLVAVRDQSVMWTTRIETTGAELPAAIVDVGARTLSTIRPDGAAPTAMPANAAAHRAWMQGRFHVARRAANDLDSAIAAFEQAIATDPQFAAAHAGLAGAHAFAAGAAFDQPARERRAGEAARAAALRALALDDSLADAHAALGDAALRLDWDLAAAESHFARAIALDRDNAIARTGYGLLMQVTGRPSDTETAFELHAPTITSSEAERRCHAAGRRPFALAALGFTLGRDGRREAAQEIVAELVERHAKGDAAAWVIAYPLIGMGDHDQAFEWLSRGAGEGGLLPLLIDVDPLLGALRQRPQFPLLRSRIAPATSR